MNLTLIRELSNQYEEYVKVMSLYDYTSFGKWLADLQIAYENLPVKKTVCAKIKLLISQKLVLTREGFEATLEINNLEPQSEVANISVRLVIYKSALNFILLFKRIVTRIYLDIF
jgi:hypothetical protein